MISKPSNALLALRDFILDSKYSLKSFRHHGVTKAELLNEEKQYEFNQVSASTFPRQRGNRKFYYSLRYLDIITLPLIAVAL